MRTIFRGTFVPLVSRLILIVASVSCVFLASPNVSQAQDFTPQIRTNWIDALAHMTAQLVASGVEMTGSVGAMIDGQVANQTQLTLQTLQAQSFRDYTPSEGLCRFGTLSRSLATSDNAAHENALALDSMMQNRETQNRMRNAVSLDVDESVGRLHNLRTRYCNPGDNDSTPIACNCDIDAGTCTTGGGVNAKFSNRDLDFARLIGQKLSLNIDLRDGTLTDDERDALAFLGNAVAFRPFPVLAMDDMDLRRQPQPAYILQNMRRVTAARSVARSSLVDQVARKSSGGAQAAPFMTSVLQEMGLSDAEAKRVLASEGGNPSYEAQMEILTKKLYQNPNFYANLMDKPANIERQMAAMQAVKLMQRRDLFESLLRREMLLSQMAEIAVGDEDKWMNVRRQDAQNN